MNVNNMHVVIMSFSDTFLLIKYVYSDSKNC